MTDSITGWHCAVLDLETTNRTGASRSLTEQHAPAHPATPTTVMKTPSASRTMTATFSVGVRSDRVMSRAAAAAGTGVAASSSPDDPGGTGKNAVAWSMTEGRPNFRNRPPASDKSPTSWT